MNRLLKKYKRSWIALVQEHADELREFAHSMYDSNIHSDDAWYKYNIDGVDVDVNIFVDDNTIVNVTIYPVEDTLTITDMQVDL